MALYTLSDFGAVSLLRYETFTWVIYLQYEASFDRTLAAALSMVLVVLALGILVTEARTRGRSRYYRSMAGAIRPPAPVRLGRWRWPAFAFCSTIVLFAMAMPMSVLGYWVIRGVSLGEPLRLVWSAALNSVYVSSLAAAAAIAAGLPVAILTIRYPGRVSALLERITYVGFALPGIVIALAQVYREYQGRDVEFVGISIWDTERDALKYIERYGITYPNGLDPVGRIAIDYGVTGIPEKYFADRNGRLMRKFIGPMGSVKLREILDELLGSPVP